MPAKDIYHETVKHALMKDGWTITHDPYTISFGMRNVFVDLGGERFLAAEKDTEKIAVEIKSFQGVSDMREFENAIGQFVFYRSLLTRYEADRKLFLAVPYSVMITIFDEAIARPVIEDMGMSLLAFDPQQEVIVRWKA